MTTPDDPWETDERTGMCAVPARAQRSTQEIRTVLRVASGTDILRHALLEPGCNVVIGRDPACGLVLNSPSISRRHAVAEAHDDQVFLSDLGSTNGTWINGERVAQRRAVRVGDRIEVGHLGLRLDRMSEGEVEHLRRVAERLDTARHDPLTGALTQIGRAHV